MWRATARLVRADLARRPMQAALAGLVIAIAAGTLLATLHLRAALAEPFDDLMRATNGAHVLATGSPAAVARAAAAPGVAEADAPRPEVTVRVRTGARTGRVVLGALAPDARVERPLIVAGRAPRGPGEVVLDRRMATGDGLEVGDALRVEGAAPLAIVGLAIAVHRGPGGWVAPGALPGRARRSTVALRLRDPEAARTFAAREAERTGVEARDWLATRSEFTEESRRTLAILGTATVLALLAAAFTLATAIGGRVLAERRRIGLLRAAGMTPGGVTGALVAHYAALAVAAAPLGLAIAYALSPALVSDTTGLLGTPAPGPPGPGLVAASLALVVGGVAIVCALPAWRAGRLAPVAALRPPRDDAERPSRLAAAARALRLPPTAALGAKDAYAHRIRALLTMASIVLAAVIVVCALAFEATMDRVGSDSALRGQPWDLAVFGGTGVGPERMDALLAEVPGVAEVGRMYEIPLVAGGTTLRARAIDGSPAAFAFAVPEGRGVERAGEVTLGRGALEALGARVGDRIALSAAGRRFEARVVGRHIEPDAGGRGAVLAAASLPGAPADPPTWIVRMHPGADAAAAEATVRRLEGGRFLTTRPGVALQREVGELRPVVYGLTALLLAIAGVNLLTTQLLGVRERRRDVAILGAVGATPRQVVAVVVAGGLLLALPAALAGLPLGAWIFSTLLGITNPSDGPDVATLPAWWTVALALLAGLAAAAAVCALAAREAVRLPLPVALRSE